MIVVDALFDTAAFTNAGTPRCFRNTLSCHMGSTLAGEAGTAELVAFAKRIGMKPAWIQHRGRVTEHFDLVANRRERAVKLGAVEVTAAEMMEYDRAKDSQRAAQERTDR